MCVCVCKCICVTVSVFQTKATHNVCDKPQWTIIFLEASDGQRISLSFEVCFNIANLWRKHSSLSRNRYLCWVTITSSIYGINSHCVVLVA